MSKQNWIKYAAFGLIIISALAPVCVHSQPKSEVPNGQSQKSEAEGAKQISIAQGSSAEDDKVSREKAEQKERANFDLNARAVKAAEESVKWAKYTLYMGWTGTVFIILTLIANASATIASWRATDISIKQFITAHRPKLKFRWGQIVRMEPDKPIEVVIAVANMGDSAAQIFRVGIDCVIRGDFGMSASDSSQTEFIDDPKIIPGKELKLERTCACILTSEQILSVAKGIYELCLSATIVYKDDNGTARVTGVFRIHDPMRNVFVRVKQDDDYADDDYEN